MKPLTVQDLLPPEEYERQREALRRHVIDLKEHRRITVGDLVTLVFENRDTLLFQAQEMIRAERIREPARLQEEIDGYNEQIPGSGELSATLLIEITDPAQVKPALDRLRGIDRGQTVALRAGPHLVYGLFEQGRSNEEKISAVHYIRFAIPEPVRAAIRDPSVPMQIVVTHPRYQAQQGISDGMRRALLSDLADGG